MKPSCIDFTFGCVLLVQFYYLWHLMDRKNTFKQTCAYTVIQRDTRTDTHTSELSVWPLLVNYFPSEMNQPAAVWLLWLPSYQTVNWLGDESGRVERWGKLFYFGLTASASLRLNDPGDSKCQNVLQQPPPPSPSLTLTPIFPRSPQILYFPFLYWSWTKRPPS